MLDPRFLTVPITHRGLHGAGVPENSLAAARAAIEASEDMKIALQLIAEGQFGRADSYYTLLDRTWNDDPFLVASDFDSYFATQRAVDRAYADHAAWDRMAALNIARSGFFSSDRTIRGYMRDIWHAVPVVPA